MDFEQLWNGYAWKQIPGCPGRYIMRKIEGNPDILMLAGNEALVSVFTLNTAVDPVYIVKLENGGLISYRKDDGTFIHTLNTEAGFKKKLDKLGIQLNHTVFNIDSDKNENGGEK